MIPIVLKTVHQKGNANGQFSPTVSYVSCVNPISKTISLPIQDHPADPLSMLKQNEAMIFIQFTHRCHPKGKEQLPPIFQLSIAHKNIYCIYIICSILSHQFISILVSNLSHSPGRCASTYCCAPSLALQAVTF